MESTSSIYAQQPHHENIEAMILAEQAKVYAQELAKIEVEKAKAVAKQKVTHADMETEIMFLTEVSDILEEKLHVTLPHAEHLIQEDKAVHHPEFSPSAFDQVPSEIQKGPRKIDRIPKKVGSLLDLEEPEPEPFNDVEENDLYAMLPEPQSLKNLDMENKVKDHHQENQETNFPISNIGEIENEIKLEDMTLNQPFHHMKFQISIDDLHLSIGEGAGVVQILGDAVKQLKHGLNSDDFHDIDDELFNETQLSVPESMAGDTPEDDIFGNGPLTELSDIMAETDEFDLNSNDATTIGTDPNTDDFSIDQTDDLFNPSNPSSVFE